jgi:hypothetical protein
MAVTHGDHTDYVHDGHRHAAHAGPGTTTEPTRCESSRSGSPVRAGPTRP